jgi:hypothetical protein
MQGTPYMGTIVPVRLKAGSTVYKTLHQVVNRMYPRSGRCEYCGRTGRTTHLAIGRSDGYTTNRADWFEFCVPCHHRFDGHIGPNPLKGNVGEDNGRAKLTEDDVREIRRLRAGGRTIVSLGEQFGVTHNMISRIELRKAWTHID